MMNERIRELKKQATDFYLRDETLECSITELHELVELKFAELIVRECAVIANKAENTDAEIRCMYDVITEHFGVE